MKFSAFKWYVAERLQRDLALTSSLQRRLYFFVYDYTNA